MGEVRTGRLTMYREPAFASLVFPHVDLTGKTCSRHGDAHQVPSLLRMGRRVRGLETRHRTSPRGTRRSPCRYPRSRCRCQPRVCSINVDANTDKSIAASCQDSINIQHPTQPATHTSRQHSRYLKLNVTKTASFTPI